MKKGILMLMVCSILNGYAQGNTGNKTTAWHLNASYKGDLASNLNGGIETGTSYLGLADLFLHFDAEQAGLWKGGQFLLHGANTHGGEPSANLIGDFQVASNIEAGNHTFLYELWFKQTFASVATTIGLQDLNTEFAYSDVAGLFLNSSFGVHSVIADNITAPIFPLTSPGITICWNTSDQLCFKSAVYKGCPIDFDENPYNIKWNLNYLKGLLWITETHYSWTGSLQKTNELKAGAFYHHHCEDAEVINSETGNDLTYDYGFYAVGNHQIFRNSTKGQELNVFYQLGVSPRNNNFGYLGTGCSYSGLLTQNGTDELGFAVAWGMLTPERGRDEIAMELTYKIPVTENIYFQPDLQYIIHPGGTDQQLNNATVAFIRLGLEL